jgi:hypothetical protein
VKESGSFLKKGGARPAGTKIIKSFLLLFFKKEGLASAL